MSYNAKETQTVMGDVEKNHNTIIRVSRIIPDDKTKTESIDIRQCFIGDDEEWHPTQKGIRVSSEDIPQLMKIILDAMTTEEFQDLEGLGYFVDETSALGYPYGEEDKEEEDEE